MGGMEMLSLYESLNLHTLHMLIYFIVSEQWQKSITIWNLEWIAQKTVNSYISPLCENQMIVEQLHSLPKFYSEYQESRKVAVYKQSLLENKTVQTKLQMIRLKYR